MSLSFPFRNYGLLISTQPFCYQIQEMCPNNMFFSVIYEPFDLTDKCFLSCICFPFAFKWLLHNVLNFFFLQLFLMQFQATDLEQMFAIAYILFPRGSPKRVLGKYDPFTTCYLFYLLYFNALSSFCRWLFLLQFSPHSLVLNNYMQIICIFLLTDSYILFFLFVV